MPQFEIIIACIAAYLFGSISTAVITSKLMHLPDPRTHGSHNPGATNVLRLGGKGAAAITLFGDALKGVIPVAIAIWYGLDTWGIALTAFAAFLGHLYPIYFKFVGGKGVATYIGCLLVISWPAGLGFILIWLSLVGLLRLASLGSIITATVAPLLIAYFSHDRHYVLIFSVMSALLIYRHRNNIAKLLQGNESRINL